jgi:shikimate dehydrogenase
MSTPLKLGIIGYPLGHTLSPVMHHYWLQQVDLPGHYHVHAVNPVQPNGLAERLVSLAQQGYRGLNVTIPYKTSIMPLLDAIDPVAQAIGAVNTVVFEPNTNTTTGFNTDVTGFIASLPPTVLATLGQCHVLVLGAGGSARAIVAGLLTHGVQQITVVARDQTKAQGLLDSLQPLVTLATTAIHALAWSQFKDASPYDVVVNTTPIGMSPQVEDSPLGAAQIGQLPSHATVVDIIYNPAETSLLAQARQQGLGVVNGLPMLVHQGAKAFTLWTGLMVNPSMIDGAMQLLSTGHPVH